jgi:hypothetical protein
MSARSNKGKSLDYPLYERMKKQAPQAARYWLLGDRLFHAGLFLTMTSMPALFFAYTQAGLRALWVWIIAAGAASAGTLGFGIYFKREAYKLAIKAGIDVNKLS